MIDFTVIAAHQEFVNACRECGVDPKQAETATLSAPRELLPPAALQVLNGGPATVEYWQWLENEVAAGSAGQA
jgi:hypothetical protein